MEEVGRKGGKEEGEGGRLFDVNMFLECELSE